MPTLIPTRQRHKLEFANLQTKKPIDKIREDEILFYDIEANHQYAPYAKMSQLGVKYGFEGIPKVVKTKKDKDEFKEKISDSRIFKVGFNNANYDELPLKEEGFVFNNSNHHDGFFMAKALYALLPSYSLKFINWWLLGDHHFPEGRVEKFKTRTQTKDYSYIPPHLLNPYHIWDLEQHKNIFCLMWDRVQIEPHWSAYMLDLSNREPIQEMEMIGGLDIDLQVCKTKIEKLQKERDEINADAFKRTGGIVSNVNSAKQVGEILDTDGLELELTDNGSFHLSKKELLDLRSEHPLAQMMYRVREINGVLKYFENYEEASKGKSLFRTEVPIEIVRIPRAVGISTARTRRFTSGSLYGINFQNSNEEAKEAHRVPDGTLGVWFDATQIENVVHIFESEDHERRKAYEADEEWSEYVWLCNKILGTNLTKKELDDKEKFPSESNPNWSKYKEYKTTKLMLNFGAGPRKFSLVTSIPIDQARKIFEEIHEACPAIHGLQRKCERLLRKYGKVQDVFGHTYTGPIQKAYKVVAYWVQGCGTGSLPKAQIRANWETLQACKNGIMVGTTHDDNSCRLRLDGPSIIPILQELNYNMTERFSYKFDNIPLRSKMYLSRTTEANKEEVSINDLKKIQSYLS